MDDIQNRIAEIEEHIVQNDEVIEETDELLNALDQPLSVSIIPDTIWEKPFSEYTPTEGYLLLLFVLVLSSLAYKFFRRGW